MISVEESEEYIKNNLESKENIKNNWGRRGGRFYILKHKTNESVFWEETSCM